MKLSDIPGLDVHVHFQLLQLAAPLPKTQTERVTCSQAEPCQARELLHLLVQLEFPMQNARLTFRRLASAAYKFQSRVMAACCSACPSVAKGPGAPNACVQLHLHSPAWKVQLEALKLLAGCKSFSYRIIR